MYDYVIVGAGSAGCVLAHRLSEDPRTRVLLLEAGGRNRKLEMRIPAAATKLFRTAYDWAYETEPQPGLNGRRLYWPRGKGLGGSSAINFMIYIRGHRFDYDRWAALGNPGWSFVDVLPYFRRAEHQERGANEFHGVGGPLDVADLRCPSPLSQAFLAAAEEIGMPPNLDFNGAEQDGVGLFQVTQRRGERCSTAAGYLARARSRRNLVIETGAQVTRVLLEGTRAVGVAYLRNGEPRTARTSGEVLLTGGAINSPQLLLLSGIGPCRQLEALGIPVALDLPGVGENLQDHLLVLLNYACTRPVSLDTAERLPNLLRWLLAGRGPLTSNVAEAGAFLRTRSGLPAPDLHLVFAAAHYVEHGFMRLPGSGFSIAAVVMRPESRGRVFLASMDPLAPPAIDPGYLASSADLSLLLEGVRRCRRLIAAKAFDPFRGTELRPGPDVARDDAIADFVRASAETQYHPVGTCRMGADPTAVVDARLRVHGVAKLRVADASIMPTLTTGNTNAPTIMIAEKGADLVREDAGVLPSVAAHGDVS